MKFFRHYQIRLLSIFILMLGFAPFLMPDGLQAKSPEYVSSWLQGFAGENHYDAAKEKISRINDIRDQPDRLLKRASRIISENPDLFALPSDNPDPSDEEIFTLLLQEWNRHHQSDSMGQGFFPERQNKILPLDTIKLIKWGLDGSQLQHRTYEFIVTAATEADNYRLEPLSGGKSINAP